MFLLLSFVPATLRPSLELIWVTTIALLGWELHVRCSVRLRTHELVCRCWFLVRIRVADSHGNNMLHEISFLVWIFVVFGKERQDLHNYTPRLTQWCHFLHFPEIYKLLRWIRRWCNTCACAGNDCQIEGFYSFLLFYKAFAIEWYQGW